MKYLVTHTVSGSEKRIYVDADSVSYDPHWVSFHKEERQEVAAQGQGIQGIFCPNCTPIGPRRGTNVTKRYVVAAYPTHLVRGVLLQADDEQA